jgi:L-fucose isomerase-like protein
MQMTLSLLDAPPLERAGPVRWFHGAVDEPRFVRPFATTVAALRAARAAASARLLRIGGTAPGFYALEETPAALSGVTIVDRTLTELFDAIGAVPDAEAERRAAAAREGHDVDVDTATLLRAARIEAALERLADEARADALAVRCWPEIPDRCDAMACAAMGTLAGRGRPAACEGDVMGALSMLALQAAADGPAVLMDLSDLDEAEEALLLWHCGNAPAAWADPDGPRPRLTTHFNRDGVGPVRDQTLRPGPATGFRLVDGGRAAVVAGGTLTGVRRDGFDGVRGWWRDLAWSERPLGVRRFLAELLEQRVPHHLAFAHGDHRAALAEASGWLGAAVRPVGERPFADAAAGAT